MSLWFFLDLSRAFKEVLVSTRQCRVAIVPLAEVMPVPHSYLLAPKKCRKESFIISAPASGDHVWGALHRLAEKVPLGCTVWLKWTTLVSDEEPPAIRARLHTNVWITLCNEYPFLSPTEVVELALLPPEKRRLYILGRPRCKLGNPNSG